MAEESVKYSTSDLLRGDTMFMYVEKEGKKEPIAFATSLKLDISQEEIDTANKMGGKWKTSIPGKSSWTASSDAMITNKEGILSYDVLFEKMTNGEAIEIQLGTAKAPNTGDYSLDTAKASFKGNAYISSLSMTADNGAVATCSVSLNGSGALEKINAVQPGA